MVDGYSEFIKSRNIKTLDLLGQNNFIGSQPIQLTRKTLSHIYDPEVLVTPKLDGNRYLMYVARNKVVTIDRTGVETLIPGVVIDTNDHFLFDCEEFGGSYFLFDILIHSSSTGNNNIKVYKFPFYRRLGYMIDQLLLVKVSKINMYVKQFYFKHSVKNMDYEEFCDMFSNQYKFLNLEFEFDGIIIMNKTMRYYLAPQFGFGQYKWKPKEKLTIDLKYKQGSVHYGVNENKYDCIVEGKPNLTDGSVYEFQITKTKPKVHIKLYKEEPREKNTGNSYLTIESTIRAYNENITYKEVMEDLSPLVSGKPGTLKADVLRLWGAMLSPNFRIFNNMYGIAKGDDNNIPKLPYTQQRVLEYVDKMLVDESFEINAIPTLTLLETKKVIRVSFLREYEVGFKGITPTPENLKARKENLGLKNMDSRNILERFKKILKVTRIFKEVDYITQYVIIGADNQKTVYSDSYKYEIDVVRNKETYNLISLQSLKDPVETEIRTIGDYNIVFEKLFNNYSTLDKPIKENINRDPRLIKNQYKKINRKVYRLMYSRYIIIVITFIKQVANRVKRNPIDKQPLKDNKGVVQREWEIVPERKSFIELDIKHESLLEEGIEFFTEHIDTAIKFIMSNLLI